MIGLRGEAGKRGSQVVDEKLGCDFGRKDVSVIGSAPECDIRIPGAAPRLAVIKNDSGKFTIEGAAHTQIAVNNRLCSWHDLRKGDRITLVGREFKFTPDGLDPDVARGGSIWIQGLTKRFKDKTTLRNVSLSVHPATMMGIFGPSGSGKTTLIKCLLKILPCNRKEIEISGTVSYVRQEDLHFDGLTVSECLRSSATYRIPGADLSKKNRRVAEVLQLVDLRTQEHSLVAALSGGERKRLSIALELLYEPGILVLDEPTSSLDPYMQAKVMDVLRTIRKRGITVVCISHAVSTMPDYDHIVLLRRLEKKNQNADSIAFSGSYEELTRRLPHKDAKAFSDVFRYLDGESDDLEDAFAHEIVSTTDLAGKGNAKEGQKKRLIGWREVWQGLTVTFQRTMQPLLETKRGRAGGVGVSNGTITLYLLPVLTGMLIYIALAGRQHANMIALGLALVLSLMWLSMTMSVRLIVAEREICEREIRAGLSPLGYLLGKIAAVVSCALIQAFILCFSLFIMTMIGLYEPLPADAFNAFSAFRGMFFLQFTGVLWVVAICGGLVGLLISSVPRTQSVGSQTLAVTLLPIFLIPHLLFNRTVIGETGMRNFVLVSAVQGGGNLAYAPVRHASQLPGNRYAFAHHLFSITGFSRPAIHVMYALNPPGATQAAQNQNRITYKSWLYVEIVFLLVLMLAYACVLLLIFYYAGPVRKPATRLNEG